ncbi:MAG: hypothetical protein IH595_09170 [Bacteroidales bacterium]|nr:hypothetical protein [Bacteroidales bacterium]
MNRKITKYFMLASLFAMGIVTSCTKVGPQGPAGTNGTNGTNGTDGTAGCITCHDNSQTIEVKIAEWSTSVHATGGLEVRNTNNCATCHTSQGFLETVAATPANGMRPDTTTTGTINNPAPQNCYTCHDIHSTYTAADWTNTTTSPVVLWYGNKTVDFGKGNLCANCHQARPDNSFATTVDSVFVSSPYWGPHHGPQANIFGGAGGYDFGQTISNSPHTTQITDGCVTCHMATPAIGHNMEHDGAHNMEMYPKYDGMPNTPANINTNGCVACHTDAGSAAFVAKITSTQDFVEQQLNALETLLISKGALTSTGSIKVGKYPVAVAEALWNYELIEADGSLGVHNADYVRGLLANSISALSK